MCAGQYSALRAIPIYNNVVFVDMAGFDCAGAICAKCVKLKQASSLQILGPAFFAQLLNHFFDRGFVFAIGDQGGVGGSDYDAIFHAHGYD